MERWNIVNTVRSVNTLVAARAFAIMIVVANHSGFGISLHGGLNTLLVISGLMLAQFSFGEDTRVALRGMMRLGWRLAVPSFLIALVWQIGAGNLYLPELAFYSNWLGKSRVVLFPIWYAQALSQMLIALALLFFVTDMGARITRRPLFWTSLLYVISVAVALYSYMIWDWTRYADKLPHLIAWNFVFGWLIWGTRNAQLGRAGKILLSCALVATAVVVFLPLQADNGMTRAIVMPILVLPLIWFDRIKMPEVLARFVIIISQATLFIFFLHYFVFWALVKIGILTALDSEMQQPLLRLIAGVGGSCLIWAIWRSGLRVFRNKYRIWPLKRNIVRFRPQKV